MFHSEACFQAFIVCCLLFLILVLFTTLHLFYSKGAISISFNLNKTSSESNSFYTRETSSLSLNSLNRWLMMDIEVVIIDVIRESRKHECFGKLSLISILSVEWNRDLLFNTLQHSKKEWMNWVRLLVQLTVL